ncbi:MAG: hypothetical protein IJH73_06495 [Lachnospiraceae bacterium]|nr:hypothetical protein [Lachnospiraceae bacterium]
MKYQRPDYMQPGIPTQTVPLAFSSDEMVVPKFEYPISVKENFDRAADREDPVWVPNTALECVNLMLPDLTGASEQIWGSDERYDWTDDFGCQWTYVPSAGGSMLKPGTQLLDDITEWDTKIKFPLPDEAVVKACCEKFMETRYDPDKIISVNVGQGCTERLVAILGGYTEGMLSFVTEPEACRDFCLAFADYLTAAIDMICKYLPIGCMTYHDDWGTERDTFFSPAQMEEIVFDASAKVFGRIKRNGRMIFHSCGKIERFMPYICELGPDFLQIQERANDFAMLKREYGDRVGFNNFVGQQPGWSTEDYLREVHRNVDLLGAGGGLTVYQLTNDPQTSWAGASEIFYYSREYYGK